MKGIGIDIVNVKKLSDKVADKILSKKELAEFKEDYEVIKAIIDKFE